MCICLNCDYLAICKQYHFIETKHSEEHINLQPSFTPLQTITKVNFYSVNNVIEIEWDIIECLSFKEKPANWIFL